MANQQPPVRPWFRLGSIARPGPAAPAPAPAPAPEPRPALARPAFRPTGPPQTPAAPPPPEAAAPPPPPPPVQPSPVRRTTIPPSPDRRGSVPPSPITKPSSPPKTVSPSPPPREPKSSPAPIPNSPMKTVPAEPAAQFSPPKNAPIQTTGPTPYPISPPKPAPIMPTYVFQNPAVDSPIKSKPAAQTPPESRKATAPPPSPLVLPPAQWSTNPGTQQKFPPEAEQKTVLVQKKTEKPKGWFNSGDHGNRDPETKEKINRKKFPSDSDDSGMRVITITGENRGAVMELISNKSPNKHGFHGNPHHLHKKGNPNPAKTGEDSHSDSSTSSSEDGKGKGKKKLKDNGKIKSKAKPMNAYLNSNVQGVNSSIMYNSTCNHHDPGVHLTLQRKPAHGGGGFEIKEHGNGYKS